MAKSFELLGRLSSDQFTTVVNMSPKKVREELFRRAGVKNRGGAFALKSNQKTEARIKKLYEAMVGGSELPDELGEEVIRQYLYHRRSLLSDALDFLGVEHDEGLTDADLDFLEELDPDKASSLRQALVKDHDESDVDLYLGFMKIPTK